MAFDTVNKGLIFDSVDSNAVYTPTQYARQYLHHELGPDQTIEDLREWMNQSEYKHLWDFCLTDITEVMEQESTVVLVIDFNNMARWFEIPDE